MDSLNYAEIELLLKEWHPTVGMVQNIKQLTTYAFFVEIYNSLYIKRIKVDLNRLSPVVHQLYTGKSESLKNGRFVQLLISVLKGGYLVSVSQIDNNRIIMFHVKQPDYDYYLYIRLWASKANAFLCNKNRQIIDSFFRSTREGERHNDFFQLPSPNKKIYKVRKYDGDSFNKYINDLYTENFWLEQKIILDKIYAELKHKNNAAQKSINETLMATSAAEQYKQIGDLLLSHQHTPSIKEGHIKVVDYYHNNQERLIAIDNTISLSANAQQYYEKYQKNKKNYEYALQKKEKIEEELVQIENWYQRNLQTLPVFENFREKKELKEKHKKTGFSFDYKGYHFNIGRSAQENDDLLRFNANGLDWWFHVKGYSGGYIIVKNRKKEPLPQNVLLAACALAVNYSRAKKIMNVDVTYTQVKYLKHLKKGKKGQVLVTQDKTIYYKFDKERIEDLLTQIYG